MLKVVEVDRDTPHIVASLSVLLTFLLDELKEENWIYDDLHNSVAQSFALDNFKVYAAYNEEELVGAIGFYVVPLLWNKQIMKACEAFWYVKPTYRGKAGSLLLNAVEKNLKCDIVSFGIQDDRLAKFLERRGYKRIKEIMEKVL